MITYFDPAPAPHELPEVLASPFDHAPPHPLARRAAEALLADLRAGRFGVDLAALETPGGGGGGKMFGVLVVRDRDGRIGYLRGFSGMLDGRWELPGFAPPLFDRAMRDAMWPAGQDALRAHEVALRALAPELAAARAELWAHDARGAAELEALRARHRERRATRHQARERATGAEALHALDQESRADAAERRRFAAARDAARAPIAARVASLEQQRAALEQARADESRELMKQVHDTYVIVNARGERRGLRELFAPGEPPAGAGDCAGPKLLGAAYMRGLRPLALAEVWWGAPPATGGRHAGSFYPSCRGKCGPILPFMLGGLAVTAPPVYGADAIGPAHPLVVHEDEHLVIVDKPCGLLSVPGRGGALRDSVLARLRVRYPDATGPLLVHRLDLDTSGLLVAAKDPGTHAALQAQFARREVDKRYVAILEGEVSGDRGEIALALRVDLDDRPRQLHDPVHGKAAVTRWQVVAREAGQTRVALFPLTGRTHQLRVHAAHPRGLRAPILGDRLYGRASSAAPRLMLHAEHLAFVHPRTGERLELTRPAPF